MAVRTLIEQGESIYFITFTCQNWLPLFEITNSYDTVYKWFDYLKSKGHLIKGYVVMPNHLHVLVDFGTVEKGINTIVSNGKRFMAYEIVKRLKQQIKTEILLQLKQQVTTSDKERGKQHQVFERSFDCKEITNQHFFLQKLDYIHNNPCSGIWNLSGSPVEYEHSSAQHYIEGKQGVYLMSE